MNELFYILILGTSYPTPTPWVLETKIDTLEVQKRNLERKLWSAEKKIKKMECDMTTVKEQNFNPFKLKLTNNHYTTDQIKNGLQLRFAVGWKGYKYMVTQSQNNLPSYDTI